MRRTSLFSRVLLLSRSKRATDGRGIVQAALVARPATWTAVAREEARWWCNRRGRGGAPRRRGILGGEAEQVGSGDSCQEDRALPNADGGGAGLAGTESGSDSPAGPAHRPRQSLETFVRARYGLLRKQCSATASGWSGESKHRCSSRRNLLDVAQGADLSGGAADRPVVDGGGDSFAGVRPPGATHALRPGPRWRSGSR
jgi:hypothetical protein